jgi:hypothetical protein
VVGSLLPTAAELTERVARCPVPVALYVIGMDLRIVCSAGQLVPLLGVTEGAHVCDLLGTTDPHHPSITALRAAFLGEVVVGQVFYRGALWDVTRAPLLGPDQIIGVVCGVRRAAEASGLPPVSDTPQVYHAVQGEPDCPAGAVVTVRPSGPRPIRVYTEMAQGRFDSLLLSGALVPDAVTQHAPGRGARQAVGSPGPPVPRPPTRLRLLPD